MPTVTCMPQLSRPRWPAMVCAILLFAAGNAQAAGIGKGQLKSRLGQALDVEFEIYAQPGEPITERCFKLVRPLDRPNGPEDVTRGTFALSGISSGQRTLRLSTTTPVSEPVISVTLEMHCDSSRLIRSFTFLPDLPATDEPTAIERASAGPASAAPEHVAPASGAAGTAGAPPEAAPPAPPARSARPSRHPADATPGPTPALTSLRVEGVQAVRRKGRDRISLSAIAGLQQEALDAPPVLKLSASLALFSGPVVERSAPQQALLDLERRLAERAYTLSLGNYDTRERLRELMTALEEARAIARQLPEGVELPQAAPAVQPPAAEAAAPAPKPLAKPAAAPPSASSSPLLWFGAIVLVLIGGAFVGAQLWRRQRASAIANRPLSESWTTISPDAAASAPATHIPHPAPARTPAPVTAAENAANPANDAVQYNHPRDMIDSISVSDGLANEFDDQFAAHLEAAEIMICFGRYQSAATEVSEFITENPDSGLRPRLALLDIYRRGNMKEEFDGLAGELVGQFNIARPTLDSSSATATASRNLDAFPHIIGAISAQWTTAECLPFIRHLTTDTRGGTRVGFDFQAAEELALLESILQFRNDQKSGLPALAA